MFVNISKTLIPYAEDRANSTSIYFPKETVTVIMLLYKNTKAMVCSPDGNTDFFDIVTGVLQEDTIALYMFIICLDYIL